jgi:protein gp37
MGETTGISWTDHTFNPWWGCIKVSKGCDHCYAETLAVTRSGLPIWGPAKTTDRKVWPFDSGHWQEPLRWQKRAETSRTRSRVFSGSMCDIFEDHPQVGASRERLFTVAALTPWLDWQFLTKRPENVLALVPEWWLRDWPPNVWLGTSVEDQASADRRIPELLRVPAPILWLSLEPLIGPVILPNAGTARIRWAVVGGESGPGHRPMREGWALDLLRQCRMDGVPFFFKQWGGATPKSGGDLLGGQRYHEFPRSRQWPADDRKLVAE